jgi:Variant SH3 domain
MPQIISAVFSLLPYLLASQIEIQNTLLGHYYTALHTYAQEVNFPSPPPPMDQVVQEWQTDFLPIQQEVESFATIANGKAVRGDDDRRHRSQSSTRSHSTGFGSRRPSSNRQLSGTSPSRNPPPPKLGAKPLIGARLSTSPSAKSNNLGVKIPSPAANTEYSSESYSANLASSHGSNGTRGDYFSRERQPSSTSTTPGSGFGTIGKKKPPPPPPRLNSGVQATYVTALYDFGGQGAGDLVFREGDRIRVIKKTDSTDDWWEGELRGVKGSFPANYCQ